ncbi:hypothetical protein CXB51_002467 [Gossypium anomalum]|uniref:Integrase catalytic domain-containing protein n=1 Tax=Gossypium anomalum TaxID=47600 RepID=A0A8J5ZDP4_9ROSI|nr:hypothetical protein CXB51_002467 [Gossypium anomalum]
MATTYSADSDSIEPTVSVFLGDRVVTSFPRHEVVKIDADSFIQWQQQIRLIFCGCGLLGFLDGMLTAPPRFVLSSDALLTVSRSLISEAERMAVLLAGLSSEFEAIVSHASLSPDVLVAANVVEGTQLQPTDGAFRGGHPLDVVVVEAFILKSNVRSAIGLVISHNSVTADIIVMGSRRWKHKHRRGAMVILRLVRTGESWNVRTDPLCMVKIEGPLVKIGGLKFGQMKNDVNSPNLNSGSYGRNDFGIGRCSLGPQFGGDSLGHRMVGRLLDRVGPTVHEALWRTKPRARVFSVDSSSYDSSQFVGIPPRLPELHASNYFDATTYDSNFNTTDSYVSLPVGSTSWCPDSGATHHVCRDTSDLHGSIPYSGHPDTENLNAGQVRDGFYHLLAGLDSLLPSLHNAALHVCSPADDVFRLWHNRLGHPANNIKGKSHKLPFSHSSIKYVDLFELVVSDLWGPAAVPCEENLYYVSFIDMTSRFTWVYLISRKSQALECFGQFQNMVFTQFGKHIKQFQSDWGGEFHTFSSVLANQGILHPISCPHTSEQNGVADLQCILLIDCLLRFSTGRPHFKPSIFLGYSSRHKGYFCPTPDGKVIVSRHVVFDENQFLFSLSSTGDKLPLNTTTYVPVVQSVVPNEVRLDHVSATEDSVNSPIHNGDRTQHDSSDMYSASQHSSHSRSAVQEEVPSTANFPTEPPTVPPVSTINTHAMVSRSKAGIFKPKALCADKVEAKPCSVKEALAHPDWRLAVQAEFDALLANSTWELSPLPPGRKVIGCKWLFRIKKNPDGMINRRKARLVAKGCSQVLGCDFKETFSLVVKPATIRAILSIAVTNGWSLRQVDVNNVFLNGDLTDEVFMQQPPGYEQSGPNGEKLLSKSDASLFVRSFSDHTLYVLVYVDNIVITGSSSDAINCFVQWLYNKFALKDMGELHYFLGIEVSRSPSGSLYLCQRKYIRELLARSSMTNAKSVHTPMVNSSLLSKDESEPLADPTEYHSIAGALQYIVLTRPDIAYAVNRVCQFMHAPTSLHMVALK